MAFDMLEKELSKIEKSSANFQSRLIFLNGEFPMSVGIGKVPTAHKAGDDE
jgi:hypothetical protein